ncbi:LytTR family DNA-binding domain-containing protein [Pedobacter sp.]
MVFVSYNDFWLRVISSVIAAHFIVVYGVEKSLFHILLTPVYYVAMAGSVTIAFILITFVRMIYIRLDRKYGWIERPVERTGLQLLLGLIAPGILAFILASLYFSLRGMNILDTLYLRFDYPIILLLILFLNLYYLAYFFYQRMRIAELSVPNLPIVTEELDGLSQRAFLVNQGAKSIPVAVSSIAYFFREGSYNFLRTVSGDDYPVQQSLDEVQASLPDTEFFRANRQMLVSRKACKHFEPLAYNKLELFTEPAYKLQIVISQKRNRAFRDWL